MNAKVFLFHPGKQITQGCNREINYSKKNLIDSNNFVNETENIMTK